MESASLRIGQVAVRAGVHRETLRYYERRGLIAAPPRRLSGYRAYPPVTVERVRLIKWAQDLGFTLREIGELSRIPLDHAAGRARRVQAHADAKIQQIDGKIRRLRAMKERLRAIVRCRCHGHCPIVARAAAEPRRNP